MTQVRVGWRAYVSPVGGSTGTDTDTDAQAFITAAAITDSVQISALNTLVTDLKTYGLWTKIKALYPFVGGSAASHKFNLKDPRDLDAAFRLQLNGGWVHSSTGAKPNGTTGYAETYLNNNILGLNNISFGTYLGENNTISGDYVGASCAIGAYGNGGWGSGIYPGNNTSVTYYFLNGSASGGLSINSGSSKGMYIVSKISTTSFIHTRGSFYNPISFNTQVLRNTTFKISKAGEYAGDYNLQEQRLTYIGDGLYQTEISNLYTAIQKFQTTLGRHIGTPYVSDPDAIAFLMAAGITDGTQAAAINTLVIRMKADGVWTKMKAIYPFVGGTAASHKFNLKDPRDLDAAYRLVFYGGGIHSSTGYQLNGSNSWGDTKLIPSTILSPGNISLGFYSRTNRTGANRVVMGTHVNPSSAFLIYPRFTDNTAIFQLADDSVVNRPMVTSTLGFYQGARNNSTTQSLSNINGNNYSYTYNTTSLPNTSMFIGSINYNPQNYVDSLELSFSYIGENLSAVDMSNYYTAVQAFQTTLGRQVNVPLVSDTDAQAFLNAANITSFQQASAVNKLVVDLKAAGVWTKMKAIYPFVGGSAASHKWNLKDPRDLDAAYRLVFNGGWTHTGTGALPNGTTGYADTKFNPITISQSLSSTHLSVYTTSANTSGVSRGYIGSMQTDVVNYTALGWFYGGTMEIGVIGDGSAGYTGAISSFAGFKLTSTNGSRTNRYFKNGVKTGSDVTQTGNFFNANMYLAAINYIGSPAYYQNVPFTFTTIGDGLTDAEVLAFYNAVQTYQTSLGRAVNTPIYNDGLVLNLDAGNANSYPGTGTTWFDLASGNNGTLVNGPTYDVNNGGSLSFSTNKYVTIPTGSAYNFGTSDFTIEGWVNLNSISKDQFLISKFTSWMGNLDFVLRFEFAFRRILFYAGDGPGMSLQNSYNLVANTWYNYCISRVSGVTTFYLNGVAQSSHTGSVNIPNDKTDIRLGYAQDNGEPLDGRMSNFKVYNRGLSATEVLNNFNSTRGRFGL